MGDHPPITPMASVDLNSLSGGEASLYELITKHFLSTVSDGKDTYRISANRLSVHKYPGSAESRR